MFAFVLYDPYSSCIHIVRDYFGKKPLFYHINSNHFYAASLNSTLFAMDVPKIIKESLFHEIAESRHIHDGIYKNINELQPGHYGTYSLESKTLKLFKYFSFNDLISEKDYKSRSKSSMENIQEEFSELMRSSIYRRKCEEVKSGIILSGGVDSSLVSYYSENIKTDLFLHLDSIDNSEIDDAKSIANFLNINLKSDYIDEEKFLQYLKLTTESWEYPLVHSNGVGILLLAKFK